MKTILRIVSIVIVAIPTCVSAADTTYEGQVFGPSRVGLEVIVGKYFKTVHLYPKTAKDKRKTKITVEGTAETSFLKPGLYVQFTMKFGSNKKPIGELDRLTLVSRSVPRGAEILKETKTEEVLVTASVRSFKKGKLTVRLPKSKITLSSFSVMLTEDCKIEVRSNDLSFVRQGDTIEIIGDVHRSVTNTGGLVIRELNLGEIDATEIHLKLKSPLAK